MTIKATVAKLKEWVLKCASCGYSGQCICLTAKKKEPCGKQVLAAGGGYCLICYHDSDCCRAHKKFTDMYSPMSDISDLIDHTESQDARIEALVAELEKLGAACDAKFSDDEVSGVVGNLRADLAAAKAEISRLEAECARVSSAEFKWLVEHVAAHPSVNFPSARYYTGFMRSLVEPDDTTNLEYAAMYSTKKGAEFVAARLPTTLAGVWKAVEHGFTPATAPLVGEVCPCGASNLPICSNWEPEEEDSQFDCRGCGHNKLCHNKGAHHDQ